MGQLSKIKTHPVEMKLKVKFIATSMEQSIKLGEINDNRMHENTSWNQNNLWQTTVITKNYTNKYVVRKARIKYLESGIRWSLNMTEIIIHPSDKASGRGNGGLA